MNVLNAKYKNTKIAWDGITLPLLPGTPIGADGTIQNDADAVGIVTERFDAVPFLPELALLIAGDVEASQILYELSDEAKAALGGIRIFAADGSISGGGGGGKLYYHLIQVSGETEEVLGGTATLQYSVGLYLTSETEFTYETFKAYVSSLQYFGVPYGFVYDGINSYEYKQFSVISVEENELKGLHYDSGMAEYRWISLEVFTPDATSYAFEITFSDTVTEV